MVCVLQGQLELVVKEVDVLEGKQADLQVPSDHLGSSPSSSSQSFILTITTLTIIYPHLGRSDPHPRAHLEPLPLCISLLSPPSRPPSRPPPPPSSCARTS